MRTQRDARVQWKQLLSDSQADCPQPTVPLLAAALHSNPSPSSTGRMQVQGCLLLLALILLAATAEAGKNKKGEVQPGVGEQLGSCSCVPAESTYSSFPHREGKERWL